ncbi:hypothetical protein ACWD6P_34415 [Streptomyces sp. NPDC002446]
MAWRGAVTAAAWVAALAAAGGLGAWSLAGIVDRAAGAVTLDDDALRERLAAARSAHATRSRPSPTAAPPPAAPARTLRVTGGSLTAVCRPDGRIYLTAWSPDAGFHVDDDVARGPAATAALAFEPLDDDMGEDLPYEIRCRDGRPRAHPVPDRDD